MTTPVDMMGALTEEPAKVTDMERHRLQTQHAEEQADKSAMSAERHDEDVELLNPPTPPSVMVQSPRETSAAAIHNESSEPRHDAQELPIVPTAAETVATVRLLREEAVAAEPLQPRQQDEGKIKSASGENRSPLPKAQKPVLQYAGDPLLSRLVTGQARPEASPRSAYWSRVLTGDLATVPDDVRRRAKADDASLDEEGRQHRLAGVINRSWVADHSRMSRDRVREDWGRIRALLASHLNVSDTDPEVFRALSTNREESETRQLAREVYQESYKAGLLGEIGQYNAEGLEGANSESAQAVRRLSLQSAQEGDDQRTRFLPLAQKVAKGFAMVHAAENQAFSAFDVVSGLPDAWSALDELAEMSDDERQIVYYIAAHEAPSAEESESLFSRVSRSARRGSYNLALGALQAAGNLATTAVSNIGENLDATLGTDMQGSAEALDRRLRMAEEMRRYAQEQQYSLEVGPQGAKAEQYLVDAVGATPAALMAFSGGAGFAGLTLSGVGQAVAEARQRAPEGDQQLQMGAGIIAGTLQAGIYTLMGKLGGRALEQSLASFARAKGTGLGGYSMAALRSLKSLTGESARLLLAGKAAQATDLGMQELAARVAKTASNIDWKSYGDNLADIEANLRESAMMLPFLLIGAGRVSLRHFRDSRIVLGEDGAGLRLWGLPREQQEAIMRAKNPDVQTSIMQQALRQNSRWGGSGFLEEAMRSLKLLNTDYFSGFSNPEIVRDFLRLPAESSRLVRKDLSMGKSPTEKEVADVLARHGSEAALVKDRPRLRDYLPLWDEWWNKSHLLESRDEHARLLLRRNLREGWQRRIRYEDELKHPEQYAEYRLDRSGVYAPGAEMQRKLILLDRYGEMQDLSYQYLLNSHSLDTLMGSGLPMEKLREETEKTRRGLLGEVTKLVLSWVGGKDRAEALRDFEDNFASVYRKRKSEHTGPHWLAETPEAMLNHMAQYVRKANTVGISNAPMEYSQSLRVMLGMESCASTLFELLPSTDDFQTALSRGMTPIQAYAYFLKRELGVSQEDIRDFPQQAEFREAETSTGLREYTRRNRELVDLYFRMTGRHMESCVGEDGQLYWRARMPGGRYSRWHDSQDKVANDVAANAALSFVVYGTPIHKLLQRSSVEHDFDLNAWLPVRSEELSAYDHLCTIAVQDTAQQCMGIATRLQPGMALEQMRRRFTSAFGRDGITPILVQQDTLAGNYKVHSFTTVTPMSALQARSTVYWRRVLASGSMDEQVATDLLQRYGYMTSEELAPTLPPVHRYPVHPVRRQRMEQAAAAKRYSLLAERLADLSTQYMLANLDSMTLPNSAKEWFSLAAFCPLEADADRTQSIGRHEEMRVRVGDGMHQLMRWANRRSMNKLRDYTERSSRHVELLQQPQAVSSNLKEHITASLGMNDRVRSEQAWCYARGGEGVRCSAEQSFWDMLLEPREAWERMQPELQQELRGALAEVCRRTPLPEVMEAEALGQEPDAVEAHVRNLAEQLALHPELHEMAYRPDRGMEASRLVLEPYTSPDYSESPYPYSNRREGRSNRPFRVNLKAEPQEDFRIQAPEPLPAEWQQDVRLLSAMQMMEALRSFVAAQPYATEDGIWWNKQRYGGRTGRLPRGMTSTWVQDPPLRGLTEMISRLNEQALLSEESAVTICGVRLDAMPEAPDERPYRAVTLYRDPLRQDVLFRLMPGEADVTYPRMRRPYMVSSYHGVYIRKHRSAAVSDPELSDTAATPLHEFEVYAPRLYKDKPLQQWEQLSLEYTLDGIAALVSPEIALPSRSAASMGGRELLMRLCEDTGFSRHLQGKAPQELTAGDLLTVSLARELMLYIGNGSEEARARLREVCEKIAPDSQARQAVLESLRRSNQYYRNKVSRPARGHAHEAEQQVEAVMRQGVLERTKRYRQQEP